VELKNGRMTFVEKSHVDWNANGVCCKGREGGNSLTNARKKRKSLFECRKQTIFAATLEIECYV